MPTFATLEDWARSLIQDLLHRILEEEVTQFLGRTRYRRRSAVDGNPGSRNGHGEPRKVSLMSGPIEVRRERVRGADGIYVKAGLEKAALLVVIGRHEGRAQGGIGRVARPPRVDRVLAEGPARSGSAGPLLLMADGGRPIWSAT